RNLDRDAVLELRAPDVARTWPMSALLEQMDALESRFGYVTGDLNTGGLVNNAVELRGNDFFMDLKLDPEAADHLLSIVAATVTAAGRILRRRTRTTSIAVNRSILAADPAIHLTSNCSVSMISPALYESRVLPFEIEMARHLAPYGIHHCGGNLQKYAAPYNRIPLQFLDVGFGSDIEACSRLFPAAFLNLRMSPVRMLNCSEDEVHRDVTQALTACGRTAKVGVCCINMDGATPDANVKALFAAAAAFRAAG
ncbi:MAG: hypothetical protein KGN36_13370, partial [Acidobacteriota bacterium]|nr:hypothetical protein [Acidobacteriota bacterium]